MSNIIAQSFLFLFIFSILKSLFWFIYESINFLFLLMYLFIFCFFFRATPTAYGGSQARGPIGAVATNLRHSHSNARFEPHLRPTPQLMAMLDPLTHRVRSGIKHASSWILVGFLNHWSQWELRMSIVLKSPVQENKHLKLCSALLVIRAMLIVLRLFYFLAMPVAYGSS